MDHDTRNSTKVWFSITYQVPKFNETERTLWLIFIQNIHCQLKNIYYIAVIFGSFILLLYITQKALFVDVFLQITFTVSICSVLFWIWRIFQKHSPYLLCVYNWMTWLYLTSTLLQCFYFIWHPRNLIWLCKVPASTSGPIACVNCVALSVQCFILVVNTLFWENIYKLCTNLTVYF